MSKFLMDGKSRHATEMKNQVVVLRYIDTTIDKANPQVADERRRLRLK
jgi:hypothetical protein